MQNLNEMNTVCFSKNKSFEILIKKIYRFNFFIGIFFTIFTIPLGIYYKKGLAYLKNIIVVLF